jgi:hypothetical protein
MTDPVRRWQAWQEQMLLNRGSPEATARSDPHEHWAVLCMATSPRIAPTAIGRAREQYTIQASVDTYHRFCNSARGLADLSYNEF